MADLTSNMNYLQPTGFKILIDRSHFPNMAYFCTSVLHPSMNLNTTEIPFRRVNLRQPGDKLQFGELQLNIIMDEDMQAYQEMYNWMEALVQESDTAPSARTQGKRPTAADLSLTTLSSHNNAVKRFIYRDALPTSLGDVSFEATAGDQFLTFPVTFAFNYFEIV
jgi:hypothetical protein